MVHKESSPESRWQTQRTYDTIGTFLTASGTVLAGVATKVIKVHQYTVSSDGTVAMGFQDGGLSRGTIGPTFSVRNTGDAIVSPFIAYPQYVFKTAAGSAVFLGTVIPTTMAGTAFVTLIYTDQDAS